MSPKCIAKFSSNLNNGISFAYYGDRVKMFRLLAINSTLSLSAQHVLRFLQQESLHNLRSTTKKLFLKPQRSSRTRSMSTTFLADTTLSSKANVSFFRFVTFYP